MITLITIALVSTVAFSLAFTPAAMWFARQIGAVDMPNSRKVHSRPITRLGGLAIVSSLLVTLLLFLIFIPDSLSLIVSDREEAFMNPSQAILIAISLFLVLGVGVWDDMKALSPGPKFLVQLVAASLIYMAGFQISLITNPVGEGFISLHLFSYPLTVVWIIGITNAFNLIDGLDGLASGVAVIALGTIASISFVQGQTGIALTSVLLTGAIMGFLWYNFRPATIFLGDSGSLFLGFVLALLSIQSFTKVSTTFAILVPIFILGLPIIDTLLSMIRRFFSWFVPEKNNQRNKVSLKKVFRSIFQPDKSHIHHQLINYGFSHRNTVLVLYLVSVIFGISAFLVAVTEQVDTTIFIILLLAAVIKTGISRLRYDEIDLLHNGIFFSIYNSLVLNKRHFRKMLDSLFILLAFSGSVYILSPEEATRLLTSQYDAALILGLIFTIQTGSFWSTGLYKETIRRLGIVDVFNILKSIVIATFTAGAMHYLFLRELLSFSFLLYILDFYFMVTLILGIRVSFHLLRYLFQRSRDDNRRVLIYGAGEQGVLALQRLLSSNSNQFTPVGFIDEDPEMEGRMINGFSVFGGHWKLERLIKTKKIDELHIAQSNLHREVMKRIYKIAQKYDLEIKLLDVQLKNINIHATHEKTQNDKLKYAN